MMQITGLGDKREPPGIDEFEHARQSRGLASPRIPEARTQDDRGRGRPLIRRCDPRAATEKCPHAGFGLIAPTSLSTRNIMVAAHGAHELFKLLTICGVIALGPSRWTRLRPLLTRKTF